VQQSLPVIPPTKPPSSGPRPRVQSQFSRNRLEGGPRTRVYKPKAPSRNHLKLDNTRRTYRSVLWSLTFVSESSDAFTDHRIHMEKRNTSTSLVPDLRPLVRSQPTPPHFRTCSRFPLTTSPYDRFLQSWPHMRLQTRPSQDRNMLALSSRQLPTHRRNLFSLT